ncbi:MAG: OadG family transporter subunit [Bacteroidota bacterium]
MAGSFNEAWVLLGVGMLTVFTVLLLVVLIGNGVISFVNRYLPVPESSEPSKTQGKNPDSRKMAAVVAAVKRATKGKGHIVAIHRKEQ